MTYFQLKQYIISRLSSLDNKDIETKELMEYVLGMKNEDIILAYKDDVPFEIKEKIDVFINQRLSGIPLAYITNQAYFYGREFIVNSSTLIPRLDTEVLCERALKYINEKSYICDLCTGSGCIGITLSLEKDCRVDLIDISRQALDVSDMNIKKYNLSSRVKTYEFDILSPSFSFNLGKYDLIVSNPPYIETKIIDELSKECRNEPRIALDGGDDGLIFYRRLIDICPKMLNKNGHILFEIGYDQGKKLKELCKEHNYDCLIYKDYSNNDRVCEVIIK